MIHVDPLGRSDNVLLEIMCVANYKLKLNFHLELVCIVSLSLNSNWKARSRSCRVVSTGKKKTGLVSSLRAHVQH